MKKIISFFMVVGILFVISGCSLKKCDICEKSGADNEVQAITAWYLCDNCYYEFLIDNYGDYNNNGYSQYDTNSRCFDCGKSIDSDRLYCDRCLGYGTCQDCGKSIDSDRLYCDRCLGYGTCQDCGKSIDSDRLYCDRCLGYGTCQDCGKSIDSDRLYCDKCLYY